MHSKSSKRSVMAVIKWARATQFFAVFMLSALWGWLYAHFQTAWWAIGDVFNVDFWGHLVWTWRLVNDWTPWTVAFWFAIGVSIFVVWQVRGIGHDR